MARYKIRSGTISPKANVGDLFGIKNSRSILDLPTRLNLLFNRLPVGAEFSVDEIIKQHTLLPFYIPFLSRQREQDSLKAMLLNGGRGIHNITGIIASTVKPPKFLRFCQQCFKEDENKYGESYWHRVHQVPGIITCPIHKEPVRDSSVAVHSINPNEYLACTEEICHLGVGVIPYAAQFLTIANGYSEDVAWLLESGQACRGLEWYREQYLALLMRKNLATPSGRVFQRELASDFNSFYLPEYLRLVQSSILPSDTSWLSSIVRKPRKAIHPLRHLLMIRYLYGSVASFFSDMKVYEPFGRAPWLCLNAAAEHFMEPVVDECEITYCSDTKKPVGTFSCGCGFVYSRRGPDISDADRHKIGRIKQFGLIWEARLQELKRSGISFREIAKRLNVDTNTVIKHLLESETSVRAVVPNQEINGQGDIRFIHRSHWLKEQKRRPTLSKTQLRMELQRTYTWLYRHDREWLAENSPEPKNSRPVNKRVDWAARDTFVYSRLKAVVAKLLAVPGKPERITRNRIGKEAGVLSFLEKQLDKLPISKKYIELVTETVEEFQIRRVRWAVNTLTERHEILAKWKIERLAGLRPGYAEVVEQSIQDELNAASVNMISSVIPVCFTLPM